MNVEFQKPLNGIVVGFDNSGLFLYLSISLSFSLSFYFSIFLSFFLSHLISLVNSFLVFQQFKLKYDPKQISCCLKSEQLSRCYENKKKKIIIQRSMSSASVFGKDTFFPSNWNKIKKIIIILFLLTIKLWFEYVALNANKNCSNNNILNFLLKTFEF